MYSAQLPPLPCQAVVITGYTAAYPEPLELYEGDSIRLVKSEESYPGWVWGESTDGTKR